jgi:hypothetical protein
MTRTNPNKVNNAVFYVDERNEWCQNCANRLMDGDTDNLEPCDKETACTECLAFAAGVHPDQLVAPGLRHGLSSYIQELEKLWDMLSDTVEDGRLKEVDIPDDYEALVLQMVNCEQARDILGRQRDKTE